GGGGGGGVGGGVGGGARGGGEGAWRKGVAAFMGLVVVRRPQRLATKVQRWADPGAAVLRCCSASTLSGTTLAIAALTLFFQPATTWYWPFFIASQPSLATSAGEAFSSLPTFVSSMSARSKKWVSVAPGVREVSALYVC